MSERVHVVVRIRPFITSDPPDAELNTLVLDPAHVSVGQNRVFKVDRVYMMEDATELIYTESVAPLINRFLCGFNASVLAYGQTGTGKTFTVHSILPLILNDIMTDDAGRRGAARPSTAGKENSSVAREPLLYLQYVEVYGDTIRDLLEGAATTASRYGGEEPGKIRLVTTTTPGARATSSHPEHADRQPSPTDEHEDAALPATGCALVGAVIAPVFTMAQAAEMIARGEAQRATGATNVHEHSSRSHAILTLFHPRYACRLDVVDLAGSEREKKTGNVGVRFQESIAINTGLLALGNVMRALSRINKTAKGKETGRAGGGGGGGVSGHERVQHVPYRSSRLTRLLQDTLGGNSATVFIACVAPDTYNRDETLRTLQYCSLALRILNEPLQQYERLRRAQTPMGRRGSPSTATVAATVLPLSLRDSAHAAGTASRGDTENEDVDKLTTMTQRRALELQSAYASLQQQYDEQAEIVSSVYASYTATKDRLALCERELRKDEEIFTQQIRAMQELVCENQRLRRRLTKVSANVPISAAAAPPPPTPLATRQDKAAMVHDLSFHGGDDRAELADLKPNSHRGGKDRTNVIRDIQHAGTRDAAGGVSLPRQPASSSSNENHRKYVLPEAAATAAFPPQPSSHSPHRMHGSTGGPSDTAHYVPLEEMPLAFRHQPGMQIRDDRRGAETPTCLATGDGAATWYALNGIAPGGAATTGPAETAQSFIRHILALHGIDPKGKGADSVEGDQGSAEAAAAAAAIATSPHPSIRQFEATNVSGVALLNESRLRHSDRLIEPPPPPPPNIVDAQPGKEHHRWASQLNNNWGGGTSVQEQDDSAALFLAKEVMRYQGTNTELRHQVQILQAELDGKQREAALLRLELQEMKDFFTT
ncbi:hypothetical protein JKF63_07172 [Porcisia hertigi]|uniref:Kinesin motor domain-containing protein n=1 Tax=Porcisia hertigi TaxID=2761500 RepID=A0A836YHK5_9TRYP|nr:hypothetical protein JKF63_07172 [Porcisia hertigi]